MPPGNSMQQVKIKSSSFNTNLKSQVEQFNKAQSNAMTQFNADEENATSQFRAEMENQRQQFNAQNRLIIDQSNAQWRRSITTAENAEANEANRLSSQLIANMSLAEYNNNAQERRDKISYAFTAQTE
jgi:paraquat-inducible protein B